MSSSSWFLEGTNEIPEASSSVSLKRNVLYIGDQCTQRNTYVIERTAWFKRMCTFVPRIYPDFFILFHVVRKQEVRSLKLRS